MTNRIEKILENLGVGGGTIRRFGTSTEDDGEDVVVREVGRALFAAVCWNWPLVEHAVRTGVDQAYDALQKVIK